MKKVVGITFKAMDTSVDAKAITKSEQAGQLKMAVNLLPVWFHQVEKALSRFDPHSELSQINAARGGTHKVSSVLVEVVDQALRAAKVTDGIFDPTIIGELNKAGYNRTFEEVITQMDRKTGRKSSEELVKKSASGRYQNVEFDRSTRHLTLPPGIGLDLGGIAKGWAVDQSFLRLQDANSEAVICVNAGGDLRLRALPGGKPWLINVEDPFVKDQELVTMYLTNGAVATSNVLKRRWQHKGEWQNHLIDPRTGASCQSTVVAATVIGPTTVEAETWSKTLCILGVDEGFALLKERTGFGALVVLSDGEVVVNEKMRGVIDGQSGRQLSVCV